MNVGCSVKHTAGMTGSKNAGVIAEEHIPRRLG